MAGRNASAQWRGDLKGGEGDFTLGEGEIKGSYTFKSRFEGEGPGTNPEELIAGAQAQCYSMQLAAMLAEAGTPADSVRTGDAVVASCV